MLVDVAPVGGGDTAAGQSISPPSTETASTSVKIAATHVWRKVFICELPC